MAQSRGRHVATRGVYAIEDRALLVLDPLALDTSFVVEALIETQRHHASCRDFLDRVADAGATLVTSELLAVELAEAVFAIALKARWGRAWREHRTDGRTRRRARQLLAETSARYDALVSSLDHVSVPIGHVTHAAGALMTDWGLASYDAVHAASAIAAGAQAIATTDTGFALLPASLLVIHTDRSRLASCRDKRPR
jgi:predicted nucleic acid-binding protein